MIYKGGAVPQDPNTPPQRTPSGPDHWPELRCTWSSGCRAAWCVHVPDRGIFKLCSEHAKQAGF